MSKSKPGSSKYKTPVVCDFCQFPFWKPNCKLGRSYRIVCKACNGLASAYKRTNSEKTPAEFFLWYQSKLSGPDIRRVGDDWFFVCRFCLQEYKIRKDAIFTKKTTACGNCESYYYKYISSQSAMTERDFYISLQKELLRNVDIEATKKEFGYDPSSIAVNSIKKVVSRCSFCLSTMHVSMSVIARKVPHHCKKCISVARSFSSVSGVSPADHHISMGEAPDGSMHPLSSKKIIAANCHFCSEKILVQARSYFKANGQVSCKKCRKKKLRTTLLEKYGVPSVNQIPAVIQKMKDPITNRLVEYLLHDRYGVESLREFYVKQYAFDFYVPSANLLIECQGDYFHDFKSNGYAGTPRDRAKATYIQKYTDYKLVHVWEHEIHMGRLSKILDRHIHPATVSPIIVDDKNLLQFRHISNTERDQFLSSFHYMGGLTHSTLSYGGFYEDKLLCLGLFGGVTRNQTLQKIQKESGKPIQIVRELKRFCLRPNVQCHNLASYSMARFIAMLKHDRPQVQAVMSFSDPTVGDVGTIYKASNWIRLSDSSPSYHYLDIAHGRMIHKKTVWDWSRKIKMHESAFANQVGFKRVPEDRKHFWLKILS